MKQSQGQCAMCNKTWGIDSNYSWYGDAFRVKLILGKYVQIKYQGESIDDFLFKLI